MSSREAIDEAIRIALRAPQGRGNPMHQYYKITTHPAGARDDTGVSDCFPPLLCLAVAMTLSSINPRLLIFICLFLLMQKLFQKSDGVWITVCNAIIGFDCGHDHYNQPVDCQWNHQEYPYENKHQKYANDEGNKHGDLEIK